MRSLNTFLIMLLASFIFSQQAKIHVNVRDVCGDAFGEDVNVSLYWVNGPDTTFIQETDQHTYTFEGLISTFKYLVKVSSQENAPVIPTAKDLVIMRRSILGLEFMPDIGNFASDFNKNSGVSTLDLVLGSRLLLGITPPNESPWYFLRDDFDSSDLTWDWSNQFEVINFENNVSNLNITAVKIGSASNAVPTYCEGNCADDPSRQARLIYSNATVTKNTPITFGLYIPNNVNYLGLAFNVKALNSTITQIDNPAISHIMLDGKSADILWIDEFPTGSSQATTITNITIVPDEDGQLSDFFRIDFSNPITEAVVLYDTCVISLNKIVLEDNYAAANDCPITWPQDITIPGCIEDHFTGRPMVNELCKNYFSFHYDDEFVLECFKVVRKWTALNWGTGMVSTSYQIIKTNADFDHICNTEFEINLGNGNRYVTARQLIIDPKPENIYSFSSTNTADSIIFLKYEAPLIFQINVFNTTDETYCIAQIKKTLCDDNDISVKELVTVNYENGYKIKATDFLSSINDPCPFITDFQISFDNGPYQNTLHFDESLEGQTIILVLRYKIDNQFIVYGDVYAKLSNKEVIPESEPLNFFGYNDFVTAGMEFEIVIYSEGFDSLVAIQMGLKFNDAIVSKVGSKKLTLDPASYYFNNGNGELKILWFSPSLIPESAEPSEALFSIFIKTQRDGNLADFISVDDINFPSEAVSAKLLVNKISLDFILEERPTNSTDMNQAFLKLSPNPIHAGSTLSLSLDEAPLNDCKLHLSNLAGQTISMYGNNDGKKEINMDIPSNISSGIYILRYQNGSVVRNMKLLVID